MTSDAPRADGPDHPHARRCYRLVGHLEGQFGLAVAARNTAAVLEATGRTVDRISVDGGVRPAGPPSSSGGVNLFHLNPMDIARTAPRWRAAVRSGAPNVCVPFWELPLLPRAWLPMLSAMDAILAPTRFIEDACLGALGRERVLHFPQAAFLPPRVAPARERWGLAPDATVFLAAFDPGSDVARKNPGAAITAFERAFPGVSDVQLLVKVRPWPGVRAIEAELTALRARAASDPRIRLVEEALPYHELLSLYASADVMVSLHRSEGLGLHLMEAMSLGVVVVATGWSGNAEFMTPADSVAVPYRLVPVEPRHWQYARERGRPGQVWAEPDVDAAAVALAMLRREPLRRRALGSAAAAAMEARRRAALAGGAFDALEASLAGGDRRTGGGLARAVRRTNLSYARERLSAAWRGAWSMVARR